jgi:single-strand DNA-binding protein
MNKAIIMGRLTKDPELKFTQSQIAVATFTVAVDRRFKDASGNRQADFLPCVAWRNTAEFVSKYFRKGSMISIVGSIQTRSYDAADGTKRYVTEIVVDEAYFTGSKPQDGGASAYGTEPNSGEAFEGYESDNLPFEL